MGRLNFSSKSGCAELSCANPLNKNLIFFYFINLTGSFFLHIHVDRFTVDGLNALPTPMVLYFGYSYGSERRPCVSY